MSMRSAIGKDRILKFYQILFLHIRNAYLGKDRSFFHEYLVTKFLYFHVLKKNTLLCMFCRAIKTAHYLIVIQLQKVSNFGNADLNVKSSLAFYSFYYQV